MKRTLTLLIAIFALVGGGWMINDRAAFDRAEWLADFEQLKAATEQSYANLRWSRASKNVDLVALNTTAMQELQQATSNSAARRAIGNFISGFNDGHFHIERGPPKPVAAVMRFFDRPDRGVLDMTMAGAQACNALGFETKSHELELAGATPLDGATFAAGAVTTASGRQFGVIRLPLFQQHEYGGACEKAWQQFRIGKSGACDEKCQEQFEIYAKQEIAQAFADDANTLVKNGAEAVVIDLTGNGGGTEWAEYAAAALSAKPLQPGPVAFVRGRHWLEHLNEDLVALDSELKDTQDTARLAQLRATRADLLAMRDSAARSCTLSEVWTDRAAQPACWNDVRLAASIHPPEQHQYQRPYAGKLYIMMDQHTASASEQFAALLLDNGVAQTIGTKTMGVGCGYTNGGNPTTLEHSGLVIWMPDCARLRADGRNEFEGITPDYPVDWGEGTASKTAALLNVLDKLPRQ
jgi:hypothetical protein